MLSKSKPILGTINFINVVNCQVMIVARALICAIVQSHVVSSSSSLSLVWSVSLVVLDCECLLAVVNICDTVIIALIIIIARQNAETVAYKN